MSEHVLNLIVLETGSTRIVGRWYRRDARSGWEFSYATFERRSKDAMGEFRWEDCGELRSNIGDNKLTQCVWGTVLNLAEACLSKYRESLVVR